MTTQTLKTFLELVNRYPSPHNGQPLRLKQLSDTRFELLFEKERGLQSVDVSLIFSFVSIGLFVEYLKMAAEALGHQVSVTVALPKISELKGEGLLHCGELHVTWNCIKPNENIEQSLLFRRTSRKKYHGGISDEVAQELTSLVPEQMRLMRLNSSQAHDAIWLNQRAVFDDMFHEPVRDELDHWLRYSEAEKLQKMDGLAYDCMELSGPLMKFIVRHPSFLRTPILKGIIKSYYLRTMRDSSSVFYMMAPFANEQDSFVVGEVIMKIWQKISEHGYYLHPFGTIMSNEAAHRDFITMCGEKNESKSDSYLVFIFRAGTSKPPAESMRLSYETHLLIGENS